MTIAEHYAWTYDNLGRLSSDGRNGAEPIRTAYSYNIRSWQTGVSSGVFSEELHYTDPSACGASSAPQFNGSISSSVWSLSGGVSKGYGYSYDGLGRVTGAEWLLGGRPASGYGTSYSYDSHGNILSLSRERGSVPDGGDDLMMAYSGNRLHAMSDHGGSMIPDHLAGSIPSGMTQYAYDANGNMTRDLNSGLTVMSYNRLNLPDELTCVGSDGVHSIRYLYASDGRKLRVSTSGPGGSSSVTDYASNVVYRDGSLDCILIPGGYMTDGSYRFFVTDHLGSVRAVTDSDGNVLHTYDYYPYGEDMAESASAVSPSSPVTSLQPYRFNGKESQKFAGLPYLDYGARFYHQLSSRWTTMDPMAEKYYSVSPYAFCSGNPVNFAIKREQNELAHFAEREQRKALQGLNFVDWDGMDVWNVYEDGSISWVKQSKRDVVRTMDANGDIISRKSFKKTDLSKGTLNLGEKGYDYFTVSDPSIAKKLFEFIATPSSWGKDNNTNDRQAIVESSVIYTDIGNAVLIGEKEATPTAALSMEYVNQGAVFTRIDHVHPNSDPFPSGTGQKNGDIGTISYLEKNGIKFSTPEWDQYHIFTPNGKQYHAYDYYTTDTISPVIFSVKRSKKR